MYYRVCRSMWQIEQSGVYCYARVIQETCSTSAADINVLKVLIYYAKFSGRLSYRCALGASYSVYYYCEIHHNRYNVSPSK